jgi:hypothetical protein
MWLSLRTLAQHIQGPEFNPQYYPQKRHSGENVSKGWVQESIGCAF